MRIVNREEFLRLPSGTLYSKYETLGTVHELHIKLDSLANDWTYQDLIGDANTDECDFEVIFNNAEKDSAFEFEMDLECGRRDGLFNDKDKFAIYNEQDIRKLISRLNKLIVND